MNSVAGGGSIVSFPAALAAGLSPVTANATNAVALTPASLASAWAYRSELREERGRLALFLLPALVGGALGAFLLLATPTRMFALVVPWLVLLATVLLFAQNVRPSRMDSSGSNVERHRRLAALFQLLIGIYGGYFGAGMGIMMLAVLQLLGMTHMHRMNAVKNVLAAVVNGTATVIFVVRGAVDPQAALVMAFSASAGGWAGAAVARRVDPELIRWGVVVIGAALTWKLAASRHG